MWFQVLTLALAALTIATPAATSTCKDGVRTATANVSPVVRYTRELC